MNVGELLGIAVGVSMDAFAISICKGLSVEKAKMKHLLSAGLWFGGAQALMPLAGYFFGNSFRLFVMNIGHWLSFALLVGIGVHMIRESREDIKDLDASFSVGAMLPLAFADSIDAFVVGVSFAFMEVQIIPAILLIGIITFLFSILGIKIGSRFGRRYQSKAEFVGGCLLIFMGFFILLEHGGF